MHRAYPITNLIIIKYININDYHHYTHKIEKLNKCQFNSFINCCFVSLGIDQSSSVSKLGSAK